MVKFGGSRSARFVGALGVALLLAGCSSGSSSSTTTSTTSASGSSTTTSGGTSSSAPGVTATTINIGAITSRTGPLAGYFAQFSPGMIAYFNTVNAAGGVDGRKIELTYNLDDGGSPSQFTQLTHTLIDQDHVFAIGTASQWFTPNYFVETNTPTYGYNVTGNWSPNPNLFAAGGSVQDYSANTPTLAYFLKATHSASVGFISYGPIISASYDACHVGAQELQAAGYKVSFVDVGAGLGGSYTSDVQRLQSTGTQAVISCMQASDNISLARAIQQYGLSIKQLWLNGYDQTLLNQYQSLMQGVYLNNQGNVPFGAVQYPTVYPGMVAYTAAMNKYSPQYTTSNVAMAGWQSAALIVVGIKAAGSNLTQSGVIDATNKITDFTAGDTQSPTDWTNAHTTATFPACSSWVQVKGSTFVTVFAPGKQVFVCVGPDAKNPVPVTPPDGTPGA